LWFIDNIHSQVAVVNTPGTHHGRIHPYCHTHLKGGQESRFKAALMTTERYKRTRGAPVFYYRSHLHVCQETRQKKTRMPKNHPQWVKTQAHPRWHKTAFYVYRNLLWGKFEWELGKI
jgi:hypothetical protein